ncbi:hypothetical protein [Marinobacter pelagius]|uniref:Dolichyl-phosphate-mannose-protein mannosyltransferase n=1 Tax=Marinobacter pelagius TaxID=379482 RepID=A0A1I4U1N3_9GAMM|nr:hypothetical protein [Marinobacter pelagius]SFM82613.1 hypothetical protein SAMN04487961_1389 [Marinobacter pelagius]
MEIVSSAYHVLSASFIFFLGAAISATIGRKFNVSPVKSLGLYGWHTFFSLFYCWYVLRSGGDAIAYFRHGLFWSGEIGVGTSAVRAMAALLVSGIGLSILGTFLVFNIFGQIGLLAFWGSLKEATQDKPWRIRWLATLIIFLPSVSFWTSALGKDAISFMATGLALWSSLNLSRRGLLMAFAIGAMFIVRPHMAGLMVTAIAIAALVDSNASLIKKVLLGIGAAGVAAALVPFALRYAGVGEVVDVESLTEYIDKRQSYNTEGGGGVDIASMSLPLQLFTYLFRPLLFEARSVFGLAAALDNLILLGLFLFGGMALLRGRKTGLGENRVFLWAYALGAWLILSMTTANLGIALRQKWMFAPMLIFLFISVIGRKRSA